MRNSHLALVPPSSGRDLIGAGPQETHTLPNAPSRPEPYEQLDLKIGAAVYVCVFIFMGACLAAAGLLWLSA